jgi:hypothetical protein
MNMPWTEMLGGATGGLAILIVAALFLGKVITKTISNTAIKIVEDRLKRAEEMHKSMVAFASAVDIDLRAKRIPVYKELWEKTGLLPIWPWNSELTYKELHQLTNDLRDWYFRIGGIFLSETARNNYFEVQKCITAILDKKQTGQVSEDDYKAIRARCSALRTELTEDILSRKEAPSVIAPGNG